MKTPAQILDQYPKAKKLFMEQLEYMTYNTFKDLPLEFQWGVWLKFFDRQGLKFINVECHPWTKHYLAYVEGDMIDDYWKTREGAQIAALDLALSILEGRL